MSDLKNVLKQYVKGLGAYAMRVANPEGFEHAIHNCHPREIMESCNSVVVFGIYVGLDYYRSIHLENKTLGENRIMHIFRDWISYKVAEFLNERGCRAVIPTGLLDHEKLIHRLSLKLAAYEAGLGVYGRCGIIVTPQYGPRANFGAVLTDAELKPDRKLEGFTPCTDCFTCALMCPPKAVKEGLNPPSSHIREKCLKFVQKIREKTGDKTFLCGYCYNNCPIGKTDKRGFKLSRYRNLSDLPDMERKHLINTCT